MTLDYCYAEAGDGFRLADSLPLQVFSVLGGQLRRRRNIRDMRTTLERIKAVVEAEQSEVR